MAVIATLTRPEPASADEMLRSDRRQWADESWVMYRLVAADEAGQVVGYGYVERANWEPEGRWSVYACTHPDHRGRGVGCLLLNEAERIAREAGATELFSWCQGHDDNSFAWSEHRGYSLNRQRTESVLDLKSFDSSRFVGAVDKVRASGLTLTMCDGNEIAEPVLHSIYELDRITTPDVPVWDAGDSFPSWEQYRKEWYEYDEPFVVATAMDGDRVVGMSSVYFSLVPGKGAGVGFTAVLREYRGRGIAMAVKLMTIEEAIQRGAPRMRTNNDPDNPPMLAVNVKLGFQFIPGPRRLVKKV